MKNKIAKTFPVVLTLMVLSLLGACRKEDFSLNFSHEQHVVTNEIECATCHQAVPAGAMSKPDHSVCSTCHEIDEENPSEACLQCHKAKTAAEIEVRYPQQMEKKEMVFSHEKHTYMDAKCENCHIRATKSTSSRDDISPPKEACLGCHNDQTAPLKDCNLCHVESSPVNATHKTDWEAQHGLESKFASSKCLVCHREDTCIECHQDKKPRDHTNTWRIVTHGAEAGWNRSRCMVCHQEDFCERCHRNTEPRSHTAGWASGPTRHCSQCHFPAGAVGCSVCHKEADHPTAIDSPHPPFSGFICEECHPTPIGVFPPHQDPGIECTVCHDR